MTPACPQISVDRGLKWEEAYARSLELTGTHDGFYLSYKVGPPASPQCSPRGWTQAGGLAGEGGGHPHALSVDTPRICGAPPTHCPIQVRGNKPSCLLAQQNRGKLFTVYKPNIGRQSQLESLDSLSRRFHRVGPRGPLCALNAPMSSSPQAAPCR